MTTAPERRLLIVSADDDIDTLSTIQTPLEADGLRVVTVRDGQEALEAIRKHRPALVILDVMMPKLNGFQVARMIKFDQELKAIPVVFLTARTERVDKAVGLQVGAEEYLTKPFTPQQLLEAVHRRLT